MPAGVYLTPLYGVDEHPAVSFLLELPGYTILLDCGWDENLNPRLLEPLLNTE